MACAKGTERCHMPYHDL